MLFQPLRPPPEDVVDFNVDAYSSTQLMQLVGLNPQLAHEITEADLRSALRQITLQTHPDRVPANSPLKSGKHYEFYRACIEKLGSFPAGDHGPPTSSSSSSTFEEFLRRSRAEELKKPVYQYDAPTQPGHRAEGVSAAPSGKASWSAEQINARFEREDAHRRSAFQRIEGFDQFGNVAPPQSGKQVLQSFERALQNIAASSASSASSSSFWDEHDARAQPGRPAAGAGMWIPKTQALPGVFDTGGLMSASLFDPNGKNRRRCGADEESVNAFAPSYAGNHIEDVFDPRRALAASALAATTPSYDGKGMSLAAYTKLRDASLENSYGSKESHQAILDQMQKRREQEYQQKLRDFYRG